MPDAAPKRAADGGVSRDMRSSLNSVRGAALGSHSGRRLGVVFRRQVPLLGRFI